MDLSTKTLEQLNTAITAYTKKLSLYNEERNRRFNLFLSWVEKRRQLLISDYYCFDYYSFTKNIISIAYTYEREFNTYHEYLKIPLVLLENEQGVTDYINQLIEDQKIASQLTKEKAEALALQRQIEASRKQQQEDINRLAELAAKYPDVLKELKYEEKESS